MVKKKSIKKQKITLKREYILWSVILILIASQCLSAWHIVKLREHADKSSDFSTSVLLKNAEEERYKYPVIDVSENRVYIPELRIYLPLDEASRNMRYDYREHGDGFRSKVLYLSISSVVGKQRGDRYASCDKMVFLAPPVAKQLDNNKVVGTIEVTRDGLSDIFANLDDMCWDQDWYTNQKQHLVEAIKKAKNY